MALTEAPLLAPLTRQTKADLAASDRQPPSTVHKIAYRPRRLRRTETL